MCGAWCVTNQAYPPPDLVEPLTQVELAEALRQETAVIMLIGKASSDDEFEPNTGMIANLYMLVDVRHATATVPEDLEREMAKIKAKVMAFARHNRMLQNLKNASIEITQYKKYSTDGKLPKGLLLKQLSEIKNYI